MTNEELAKELEKANLKIEQLTKRIEAVNSRLVNQALPDTMILDQKFLKRAFAVYGHMFVAGLIIAIPFWCFIFVVEFFP